MFDKTETRVLAVYWEFCEKPEVVELKRQLDEGLIHPLEYAHKILALAESNGL